MRKLALVLVILSMATGIGYGQMLGKGTKELDLEGSFDHKSAAGTQFWTALGFGYFVMDNLELIAAGAFSYDDYQIGYHPAVGAQYNFNLECPLVPFAGVNLGWGIWDYKEGDDEDGCVYGAEAGVKYFFTENMSVSAAIDYDWSTGDIWMEKGGKMVDNNWGAHWGLRYYFQ